MKVFFHAFALLNHPDGDEFELGLWLDEAKAKKACDDHAEAVFNPPWAWSFVPDPRVKNKDRWSYIVDELICWDYPEEKEEEKESCETQF